MARLLLFIFALIMCNACRPDEAFTISINAPSEALEYNRYDRLPVNVIFYGAYDLQTIEYHLNEQINGQLDVAEFTPSFLVVNDRITIDDLAPGSYELSFSATDDEGRTNSTSTILNVVE